jgi:hypothetical protein
MRPSRFLILCFLILGLWLTSVPALGQLPEDRGLAWGVYAGWSHGLGWEFDWHYRSSVSDKTTLQYHAGAFARYDFFKFCGLQVDLNYQSALNEWIFSYWGFPEDSGSDRFGITSLSLQGVLHFARLGRLRLSVLSGGGLSSGHWGEYGGFSRFYAHLTAGLGLRIGLYAEEKRTALILGAAFVHLIDPSEYATLTADYLRFFGGVEF